jgi:hypothetical protein
MLNSFTPAANEAILCILSFSMATSDGSFFVSRECECGTKNESERNEEIYTTDDWFLIKMGTAAAAARFVKYTHEIK